MVTSQFSAAAASASPSPATRFQSMGLFLNGIKMTNLIQRFWNDEEGATAIEYGLIAGLVAVAIIAAVTALGTDLTALFKNISTELVKGKTTPT